MNLQTNGELIYDADLPPRDDGTNSDVLFAIPQDYQHLAHVFAAAPDAHSILWTINEFFRHNNPVAPSETMLDDDRTLKKAIGDYLAKARGKAQA